MKENKEQLYEGRDDIKKLVFSDDSEYIVGEGGVRRIRVSTECGQMAMVPWFEIQIGGKVAYLVNAATVSIVAFKR